MKIVPDIFKDRESMDQFAVIMLSVVGWKIGGVLLAITFAAIYTILFSEDCKKE